MANISKIKLNDTTYELEDTKARTDVGDVTTLKTTDKSNLVKAVNECFQSASDGKSAIANAITGAGVSTSASATFATMATNIGTVATNKYNAGVSATKVGTATASEVLTGYTFTNSSSVGASGSMKNNGAVSQSLNAGGSYTIPAGYHNGSGKVTANSLASQTTGTATAGQILSGQTAWVGGSKVTGTMPNQGSANILTDNILLQDSKVYFNIPNAGYYEAGSDAYTPYATLASKIGLTADKLVQGNTVLGITGAGSSGKRYVKIESPSGGYMTPDYSQSGKEITASSWYTYPAYNDYSYRALSYPWTSFIPDKSWTPSVMKVTDVKRNGSWTGTIQYTRTALITPATKIVLWEYTTNPASYSKLMYVWTSTSDSTPATVFRSDGVVIPQCAQSGETSYTTSTFELWE